MKSSPVRIPELTELLRLREVGRTVGYNGIYIYLRYRAILRLLAGERLGPTLAIGCGYGIFDRLLPDDLELTGIDLADREIEFAQAWAKTQRPSYRYWRGSLEDFHFEAQSFDLILLSEVLEHVTEAEAAKLLATALSLLQPGGRLLVTVPNHWTLRNRARRCFGQATVLMDRTHLREYDLESAGHIFDGLAVRRQRFEAAVVYFPYETWVARLLPPESSWREWIAQVAPSVASHFLLLGIKEEA